MASIKTTLFKTKRNSLVNLIVNFFNVFRVQGTRYRIVTLGRNKLTRFSFCFLFVFYFGSNYLFMFYLHLDG